MNIYLLLFFTFLEIGTVSFGGGFGMIALVREKILFYGWMTEAEFASFIAVSESTPGPLAINMATFVGASQGGFFGALVATCGVVLPAFLIILFITALMRNLLRYAGVQAVLSGVRPTVIGMIVATALTMGLSCLLSLSTVTDAPVSDPRAWLILGVLLLLHTGVYLWKKKAPSPILMILISAALGIALYAPLGG